jgi:hypothetical protein
MCMGFGCMDGKERANSEVASGGLLHTVRDRRAACGKQKSRGALKGRHAWDQDTRMDLDSFGKEAVSWGIRASKEWNFPRRKVVIKTGCWGMC